MSVSFPHDTDPGPIAVAPPADDPAPAAMATDAGARVRRVAIIARARSGTHALGSILAANGLLWFDEVFHLDQALEQREGQGRFLSFCAMAGVSLERYIRNPEDVFKEYILHLDKIAENDAYVVDIKYASHHYFPKVFREFNAKPSLIPLLRRAGFAVIHLVRENYLEAWISDQIARREGRWHHYLGEPVSSPPRFTVDVNECLTALNQAALVVSQFSRWLKADGIDHVRLTYEEAFTNEALSAPAADALAAFLKTPIGERRGKMVKPKRRLRDVVANLGELTEALQGTPFADMAEAIRLADMQR